MGPKKWFIFFFFTLKSDDCPPPPKNILFYYFFRHIINYKFDKKKMHKNKKTKLHWTEMLRQMDEPRNIQTELGVVLSWQVIDLVIRGVTRGQTSVAHWISTEKKKKKKCCCVTFQCFLEEFNFQVSVSIFSGTPFPCFFRPLAWCLLFDLPHFFFSFAIGGVWNIID